MRRWIAIAAGDVTGIGPEITLKALAQQPPESEFNFLIIGDQGTFERLNQQLGLNLSLSAFSSFDNASRIALLSPRTPLSEHLTPGSPAAAEAALDWLKTGVRLCLEQKCDALVTAPVNKQSILRLGQPFIGQTELISELSEVERTGMMLLGQDDRDRWLRVALATTHLPLRSVADHLRQHRIEMIIELAAQACGLLKLPRCRIGVCGLNPHAGEGGQLGAEELEIIAPAVQNARARGLEATGPLAADSLFYHAYRGDYDAVVAMYHDQGLAPLKMIGFERGVNWTLGLPFPRTSPDHGTAYGLAGKGLANCCSMQAAISLAAQLVRSKG